MSDDNEIVEGEFSEESAEIVHVVDDQVQLGGLSFHRPQDLVVAGAELASALKDIILRQRLYSMIKGKAHVHVEGWNVLGAMLSLAPMEEWVKPWKEDMGYEAYVALIRVSDGTKVGGASAMCTRTEENWEDRDEYALRSMAITRATGKAFRLKLSWIMKLAGYEATPMEEMPGTVQVAGSSGDFPAPQDDPAPRPKKPRGKAKPAVKRNENQWEAEIINKAVDLGFANHAKNAVAVLNRSPLGAKYSYPKMPMVAGIAWFVCWDQIKTAYADKSTDQRQKLCLEAWTNVQNRKQYEAIARQSLGFEE